MDSHTSLDQIDIRGLRVDCVVGLYPDERDRVQPLEVDIGMTLDTRRAAEVERLAYTVNYAQVANEVAFLLRSCRFQMLETAARVLSRWLLAPPAPSERRARIARVRIRLEKPYALAGHGVPSLTIERDASDVVTKQESKPWGTVDVIDETRDVGIYRLNIAPRSGIPLHAHTRMRESEMILTPGLRCQLKDVDPGMVFRWPSHAAHRYDNPTDDWAAVLCVDSPPFIPDDEVEVDGEPAEIKPEAPLIAVPVVS